MNGIIFAGWWYGLHNRGATTPPGRGYLRATVGDDVRILYIGATGTEDEGWLYACRMSGPLDDVVDCKGSLGEETVQAVTRDT